MPKIVDKDEKRRQLVESAAAVFARNGYSGTKMAHVAAEAEVGKGTLYEYFASKDDLFLAVCINLVAWPDPKDYVAEPEQGLRDLIFALADSYERASGFFSILVDYWSVIIRERGEHGQFFLAQGSGLYDRPRSIVAEVIQAGQAKGTFRADLDVLRSAQIILAAIEGLRLQRALDSEHIDLAGAISLLADVMVRQLASSPNT
jgi:AcrR family transcriptional regulator